MIYDYEIKKWSKTTDLKFKSDYLENLIIVGLRGVNLKTVAKKMRKSQKWPISMCYSFIDGLIWSIMLGIITLLHKIDISNFFEHSRPLSKFFNSSTAWAIYCCKILKIDPFTPIISLIFTVFDLILPKMNVNCQIFEHL